jgi:hypothetical protein
MIGKIASLLAAILVYLAVGTLLAEIIGIGYLASKGVLSRDKLRRMAMVAQGIEAKPVEVPLTDSLRTQSEQVSLVDIARARAMKDRDLELREHALRSASAGLKEDRAKLAIESDRYNRVKTTFEGELNKLHESALATNAENARLILENIKPKQAKEQLVRMIDSAEMQAAVMLLSAMPIAKRAKVVAEFKTAEESQRLADILKLIRAGEPELTLIDDAKNQLESRLPGGP